MWEFYALRLGVLADAQPQCLLDLGACLPRVVGVGDHEGRLGERGTIAHQYHRAFGAHELVEARDHREHDAQRAAAAGAQKCADLAAQQAGTVEAEPDRAPAQRRVFLDLGAHVGQHLVAADVEGAEGHRLGAGGIEHRAVQL